MHCQDLGSTNQNSEWHTSCDFTPQVKYSSTHAQRSHNLQLVHHGDDLQAGYRRGYLECHEEVGIQRTAPEAKVGCKVFSSWELVSLPTGSGKSLCYCLLPVAFDVLRRNSHTQCILLVVSPLIALMQDQVRAMNERGVRAVYAGMADDELAESVCSGSFQLVYLSPESLLTDGRWCDMLQNPIYQERLVGFAVDEAHCVKK